MRRGEKIEAIRRLCKSDWCILRGYVNPWRVTLYFSINRVEINYLNRMHYNPFQMAHLIFSTRYANICWKIVAELGSCARIIQSLPIFCSPVCISLSNKVSKVQLIGELIVWENILNDPMY